ncbi:DUF3108 domain-containing protein [Algiphilus sp. W345]|uniref:DUF3108 domain-containing protein n=1 Tax=Banduia mediterranea TaxID=3075609 RepID=A0ABU2WEG4_9GAMM|nr:DUF3108 domain-containing protein [Algiphilus sp. W345]MDT0496249.1 DUF3108 domain-containing protein [Algiphilus sp. W345]
MKRLLLPLLPILLALGLPLSASATTLPEFKAVYAAEWKGIKLGEIVIRLTREQAECYRYESEAKPVALVRMFYGKPQEISRFCLVDGAVEPRQFVYEAGKDSFQLDFNWNVHKVFGGEGERDLPEDAQDRLGMHQAVRLWVIQHVDDPPEEPYAFTVVQDHKMDKYQLVLRGKETVEVPNGTFDAVRLERVDRKDRIARFWLAESREYMPVKVETGKDGDVELKMSLREFKMIEREPSDTASDDAG